MKKPSTLSMLAMALLFSFKALSIPKLNSFPGAVATVFLDFDGHNVNSSFWNSGNPLSCAASGMTDAQITEAFGRVAEDFRPFNINITTDSTVFLAAPLVKRVRVIITPTSGWCPGVGGVSYVGSFNWGDDTPNFVFCDKLGPNSPKMVGEACSHETGHALGLSHQSKYGLDCSTPEETYNTGIGAGEIAWAPIMGNSYYRNFTNWNNGPTPYGCTSTQDNLSIIATQNGFTYRTDDYTETMDAGTYTVASSNFSVNGVIATNSDVDAFRVNVTQNSNFHLTAIPFNVSSNWIGANLDIKLELYNGLGALIATYDPPTTMTVTVDTILTSGVYYIRIDGTGNINIGEYGSLGAYTITGTAGALPIHDVALVGSVDKNTHNLNWNIIADEPIKSITVESSKDGILFSKLSAVAANAIKFSYTPNQPGTIYYRLKVTSVLDQTAYSNTIALKSQAGTTDKPFFVSTLVHNDIMINAPEKFSYRLSDLNGRVLSNGGGLQGTNKISTYNLPNGMYIIQLSSNIHQQTERIIRQ